MLDIYYKEAGNTRFERIDTLKPGSWIYAREACLADLHHISEITGLDLADLRDSLDKYELPRFEHLGENSVFFIRHPSEKDPGLYTETLTLILAPSYVIAISPSQCDIVERLLDGVSLFNAEQKTKLLLHILLKITQEFTHGVKRLRHSVSGFDNTPLVVDSQSILILTKSEEILNQYLTALVPMRGLLETLASDRYVHFYEEDIDLLEDLMIGIRQSEDVCRVNIKSIRSMRDSYHIIFTNDVNRTIKLLTALTIIFSIPTILASIYGMNVSLPFQESRLAFWGILGATLVASLLALFWFKVRRWL